MDEFGQFLVDLPMPLGMIVTGLVPPVGMGSAILAVVAYQRQRRLLSALLVALALLCLFAGLAFLNVTSD